MKKLNIILNAQRVIQKHWIFLVSALILFLLVFKNPFSDNQIISDLEPTPDTIFYLDSARNFIQGKGFIISYNQVEITPNVPKLYSLIISPIYKLLNDPRSFYITNLLLTTISIIFFYRIIIKLFTNTWVKALLLLSFVTNYIVYWYPSVVMSENLLIPCYIISIWLILRPITVKNSILVGLIAFLMFATKYIAWTLSGSLLIFYVIKILKSSIPLTKKKRILITYIGTIILFFVIFCYGEASSKKINLFDEIVLLYEQFYAILQTFIYSVLGYNISSYYSTYFSSYYSTYFSSLHIHNNLAIYLGGIVGGKVPVAHRDMVITPIIIGIYIPFGIFINLIYKKSRDVSIYFIMSFLSSIIFILFFFEADARYIFFLIPMGLIVFGIFLEKLLKILEVRKLILSYLIVVIFCWSTIIINIFNPVVKQLNINFITGEIPYNYQTIIIINDYFKDYHKLQKPVIITTLSPFLVNFYTNYKYDLLPLTKFQNFSDIPRLWGIPDEYNLIDIYVYYLNQNRDLYVMAYKVDEKSYYNIDYQKIMQKFNLSIVKTGCNNLCNLYRITPKPMMTK